MSVVCQLAIARFGNAPRATLNARWLVNCAKNLQPLVVAQCPKSEVVPVEMGELNEAASGPVRWCGQNQEEAQHHG